MNVFRSPAEARAPSPGVVTIGNFDGVHVGHAAILRTVREHAARLGARAIAITFDPHPLREIAPERAPLALMTLEQRIAAIAETGIDALLVERFDTAFSRLSPEEFIEKYLVDLFKARLVSVGHNFRFGHEHRGDVNTLRAWESHFDVVEVPPVVVGGRPVSSSRIRQALVEGRVREARHMLGRCYEIAGEIVGGDGRGHRLTVPTLNLVPANELIPRDGVYLTTIAVDGGPRVDALTNVGVRPTFGEGRRTIETHVLDGVPGTFPHVGRKATIRFLRRIRDERAFSTPAALREQIERDVAASRKFLRRLDRARRQRLGPPGTVGTSRRET